LNSIFTHNLGEVLRVTGGKVLASAGCVTRLFGLVPVGAPIHDFRELFGKQISDEDITGWKESEADLACIVMVRLELPGGGQANVLFQTSGGSLGEYPAYVAFYGTEGTLRINFGETNRVLISTKDQLNWKELPIPQTIVDHLPRVKDWIQRDWNQLVLEFVAHIEGQKYSGYPTFYDGWIANQVIDSVRASQGWVSIEHEPSQ
jgi:predicted dehydrogenase